MTPSTPGHFFPATPSAARQGVGDRCRTRVAFALVFAALLVLAAAVWARPLAILDVVTRARIGINGFHSEYAQIDGHRIHFYAAGSGTPVVLIHGLGSRSIDWSSIMVQLVDSGFRVYAIDLLGYGESDRPGDAPYSIAQQASIVEGFLASQKLESADLVGWSMGGWIAARVALDEPQRVRRLVLCDSAGLRFKLGFEPDLFEPETPQALNSFYALLLPQPVYLPAFLSRAILRRIHDEAWVVRRSMQSMLTGTDLLDSDLGNLNMPVLIVWGRQDRLIPLDTGQAFHRAIPQSQLEVFDGCGHLAPGLCAGRVGPRIVQFLRVAAAADRINSVSAAPTVSPKITTTQAMVRKK